MPDIRHLENCQIAIRHQRKIIRFRRNLVTTADWELGDSHIVKLLSLIENLISCCYSCVDSSGVMCGQQHFQSTSEWDKAQCCHRSCSPFFLDNLGKLCPPVHDCYTLLYVDNIWFISPSVSYLERLLHCCEHELVWLDVPINFKKPIVHMLETWPSLWCSVCCYFLFK